jgi:hypothetical protein
MKNGAGSDGGAEQIARGRVHNARTLSDHAKEKPTVAEE